VGETWETWAQHVKALCAENAERKKSIDSFATPFPVLTPLVHASSCLPYYDCAWSL
jgi:hypothetical protein